VSVHVKNLDLLELLDPDLLLQMVEDGLVRRQEHPELPLAILNYTEKAAYDSIWNEVTLQCRGLIYDFQTNEVLARPYPKFFNYGQPGAPELHLDEPAIVTDKLDGSLGILYPTPTGHAIATRGSFTSDQALHATELWQASYTFALTPGFSPNPTFTYLFEIIYPQNRIVVDYGGIDDLVLLDVLATKTGARLYDLRWRGPRAETFPYQTLTEALAAEPRPNCEGFVLYFPNRDERLKIKQDDYVALHRIVTGLNARTVWEHLLTDRPLSELTEPLPDEFHPWVHDVADRLEAEVNGRLEASVANYESILQQLPEGWDRRAFAEIAVGLPESWALFNLLDGKDPRPAIWRNVKPRADWNPAGRVFGEDTA
jgi:RNA ligase